MPAPMHPSSLKKVDGQQAAWRPMLAATGDHVEGRRLTGMLVHQECAAPSHAAAHSWCVSPKMVRDPEQTIGRNHAVHSLVEDQDNLTITVLDCGWWQLR